MKILITGGAGFIGSHVSEYYAKKGHEVTVFDNLSRVEMLKTADERVSSYNWDYLKKFECITKIKGDIRKKDEVMRAVEDVDAIIHTAAQVAVTSSVTDPRTDFEINALGTFNVLEAARNSKTNPTIVYCSTNKVYGENVNTIPVEEKSKNYVFSDTSYEKGITENFSIDDCEHTPYGCSKLVGDFYVQDYFYLYGLRTAVFRMSCIYGTRQFGVEDQGWVSWFIIATLTGKPITIYGDGKQVRDVLYVTDLIQAYDAFINKKQEKGLYNIGGGAENTLSLLKLLEIIEKETGKQPKISYDDWRPSDQKVYISDISKAKKELGWEPRIGPDDGVKKLVEWVNENKNLF